MTRHWNWLKNEGDNSLRALGAPLHHAARSMQGMSPLSYFGSMGQMFDETFRAFGMSPMFGKTANIMRSVAFMPQVDIASTDKEYTITVEAAGIDEKDLRIEIMPNSILVISGEKKLESDNREQDFQLVERSYGVFERSLALPEDIDPEAIEADFDKGILTITAQRARTRESRGRRIDVKEGKQGHKQQARQEGVHSSSSSAQNPSKRAA